MRSDYAKLGLNLIISAVVMYFVMFTMIDGIGSFYHNINMFYMALMMVAPMAVLMLLMMKGMYYNEKLNRILYVGFIALFVLAFAFTRTQTPVGDVQFVRSMIPHHSGAILMCREAKLTDNQLIELCNDIVRSQQSEIEQMKQILARLH
ncbi:DUF305 domain-containing protein [Allosphingosinicella vermicomposti]|uniref:DUF305 domain-containing protein n=1 Tax=Allosphingosinicella vermicomposti TaxID=614671 RepID=UPI000D104D29|nr:DUF305 domain-containing protein [Allosphingosinicella vermicomposti]